MSLSADPRIGSELFGYRVEALLGRGGMSVVYRAHDLALDRKVALKLLAPELAEDERFRSRFLRESRVAASLDHPNVVPIYEAGEAEGLLCIAMRYVEGTDLKRLLRDQGALEPEQALPYCAQVAAALDAAHAHGLVHRDVKPSNVLIAEGGHCYLADFGLTYDAADRTDLTLTGQVVGSVDYAAPEQIEGKPVDGRSDVYSFGCLLYECLTGKVPYPKDSDLAVLWAHVNEPPPRLDAHPTLDPVLKLALAKQPSDRYQTCAALVDAARTALPKPEPEPPPRRRRRYLVAALAVLALAAGLAAGLALGLGGGTSQPKPDLTVRNNTLVRIDPNTNKIERVISVGVPTRFLVGTYDVATRGEAVWIYNWEDQSVSAVDAETNAVERTVSIGGYPPATGNSIAADAGGAWVLSSKGGSGVLSRAASGLAVRRDFPLGYDPRAVAVGEGAVWVGARNPTHVVLLRVAPSTGAVQTRRFLKGADIQSIAVGEGAVWVLQHGAITRLDPASARITKRVAFPSSSEGQIAVGEGAVWVTMNIAKQGNVLVRFDPRTLRRTKTISTSLHSPSSLGGVAVGEGAVWWGADVSGTVRRVDPKTGTNTKTIRITAPVGTVNDFQPMGIAAGADSVWVTVTYSP